MLASVSALQYCIFAKHRGMIQVSVFLANCNELQNLLPIPKQSFKDSGSAPLILINIERPRFDFPALGPPHDELTLLGFRYPTIVLQNAGLDVPSVL